MSYVLHVYRMTYKTYDMQEYILFIPRNGILCPQFFGIYLFHPLDIAKTESFLGGFAPPATWANHRSVFNGIRFYSCQNIVSTKTQQGMFRVTRNLLGYSQRPCHKWMYFSPKLRNNKTLFYNTCFVRFTLLVLQCRHTLFPSVDSYT